MQARSAFWQLVLGAELPYAKVESLIEELDSRAMPEDPERMLLDSPHLSDAEKARVRRAAKEAPAQVEELGIQVLEPEAFPSRLRESPRAPLALFAWGDASCLEAPCVAIVGTRGASTYGKAAAQKFSEALARAGVTVVSGGALGVDAAAHKAALSVGAPTVAVLPSGVDKPYPASHDALFRQIRQQGCLISPFALRSVPREYSFLARNAVVASLCDAVLVVEAPERSGSLSTAHAANDLGRQVFVVPANVSAVSFRGSHELIRSGATLVDHPDQILGDLGIRGAASRNAVAALSSEQARIVESLSVDPLPTELIAQRTGLDPSTVMAELTMLELEGRVIRATAGYALAP